MAAIEDQRPMFQCDYMHIAKDVVKRLQISASDMNEFENQIEALCASITSKVLNCCDKARNWNRLNDSKHQIAQPLHLTLTSCHSLEVLQEIDHKIHSVKLMRKHFLKRFSMVYINLRPFKSIDRGSQLITELQDVRSIATKLFIDLELIIDRVNNDNSVDGHLLVETLKAVMNTELSLFDLTLQVTDIDKQREMLQSSDVIQSDPLRSLRESLLSTRNSERKSFH